MRISRSLIVSFVAFALLAGPAAAAETTTKTKKSTKSSKSAKSEKSIAAQPKPPEAEDKTALASCKKHVESMLKESAETKFQDEREIQVKRAEDGNFDITGWVTSQKASGQRVRADFNCHAARFGGGLWTTKTSLSFDH